MEKIPSFEKRCNRVVENSNGAGKNKRIKRHQHASASLQPLARPNAALFRLQLVRAGSAAHVPEGGQNVAGFQGRSGDFWVGVLGFAVLSKDNDATRFEALALHVALEVFRFEALADAPHAQEEIDNLDRIQEVPELEFVRDLGIPKGPIKVEVFVAVEGEGEIALVELSQSLVVHSGFLDDPKDSKVGENLGFVCRELGQLLTVFAAQDSSRPADHEADASVGARVLVQCVFAGEAFGCLSNQIANARRKVEGNQFGSGQPLGRVSHGFRHYHPGGNGGRLGGHGRDGGGGVTGGAHGRKREESDRSETGVSNVGWFGAK